MTQQVSTLKRLKDVFYETRVLMGRGYTLQRFASEVLEKAVDPVMLSYIEKGKRFPNEALVYKLAQLREQDPNELLVLLWQDRILYAFSREFRKIIKIDKKEKDEGIVEAEIALLVSRAVAALPDDGSWIPLKGWQHALENVFQEIGRKRPPTLLKTVMDILQQQGLVENKKDKVRRLAHHYVPAHPEERRSLAMEFCGIFTKGILEKLVRQGNDTYVRNHYLHIPKDKIGDFYHRLDRDVRRIAQEFATEQPGQKKFVNVLMTSTPF